MNTHDLSPNTRSLICRIVQRELSEFGIAGIEAAVGEDHDGDASIIVEIAYDTAEPDLDPERVAELMMTVNRELYDAGEPRFAYIYNRAIQDEPSFGPR